MRTKNPYKIFLTFVIIFSGTSLIRGQVFLDVETGFAATGYNDVRVPGTSGTIFSLKDDLDARTDLFYRIRTGYIFNDRHTLSLLFAPLTIESKGINAFDIYFQDQTFNSGEDITGTYKFNSYRFTYRYDLVRKDKTRFGIGFTAKIRDAMIRLGSPSTSSEIKNLGFVPIINFRLDWQTGEKIGLLFEGDALAAPQGRAEDVLLAVTYNVSNNFRFKAGYRILEGGADNDEVYNFALINYGAIGFVWLMK
ncbi:MAG TPA: hypothetical protein VHO50_13960 [Bacteroidales bacterium]|nr:hypothetical protein [Bacteroidales bacterium]